jgi:phage-related protein
MAFPTTLKVTSSTKSSKPAVLVTKFGDGYEQRTVDGINANPENWDVSFATAPRSDVDSVETFLETNIGQPFDWTTPNGNTISVVCDEWSVEYSPGSLKTLSVKFKQVFGV